MQIILLDTIKMFIFITSARRAGASTGELGYGTELEGHRKRHLTTIFKVWKTLLEKIQCSRTKEKFFKTV